MPRSPSPKEISRDAMAVCGSQAATAERFVCLRDQRRRAALHNRRPSPPHPEAKGILRWHSSRESLALMSSEIFQLFPDRQFVDACQVRGLSDGAESFRAMAMVAMSGEKHSPKGVSARGGRDRCGRPCDIGRDPGRRIVACQKQAAEPQPTTACEPLSFIEMPDPLTRRTGSPFFRL